MKLKSINSKLVATLAGLAFTAALVPAQAGTVMASEKTYKQPVPEEEVAEPWWSAELSTGYDSEYMFRGVDILNDHGLHWTQLTFSAQGFTIGAWYANGIESDDDFSELDLFGSYTYELGPVAFEVGGIYYRFPEQEGPLTDTYEAYVGASYSPIEWVTASLYYYYDFDLFQAHYLQAKLETSIPVTEAISIDPWVAAAFGDYNNTGSAFVYDHVEGGVAVNVALNKYVSLSGYGAYARAGDGTRDIGATKDDEFWGGASIAFSF